MTPTQVFSCEFCEFFKNNFYTEHLCGITSVSVSLRAFSPQPHKTSAFQKDWFNWKSVHKAKCSLHSINTSVIEKTLLHYREKFIQLMIKCTSFPDRWWAEILFNLFFGQYRENETRKTQTTEVSLYEMFLVSLHKNWSFLLRIFLVNAIKSAVSSKFGHIYWRNP